MIQNWLIWVAHNEPLFKLIMGIILAILWVAFIIVSFSENKRLRQERVAQEKYENDVAAKQKYVHKHLDVFGINDGEAKDVEEVYVVSPEKMGL